MSRPRLCVRSEAALSGQLDRLAEAERPRAIILVNQMRSNVVQVLLVRVRGLYIIRFMYLSYTVCMFISLYMFALVLARSYLAAYG